MAFLGNMSSKKWENKQGKLAFEWMNPLRLKAFETPVKSVDRLLALASEVIARNISAIQIYSDDQCAAVKSFEKNLKKMS